MPLTQKAPRECGCAGRGRRDVRVSVSVSDSSFLSAVQARAARICVGASAIRGQGSGVAPPARQFLERLSLNPFCTARGARFQSQLDEATERLRVALPDKSRHWGLAWKLMNIFLRDALYSTYLAGAFPISNAEAYLELPLDKITSGNLWRIAGRGELPCWRGVKHLIPKDSAAYQSFAAKYVASLKPAIARVHLDTYWWGVRDGTGNAPDGLQTLTPAHDDCRGKIVRSPLEVWKRSGR